MEKIFKIAKLSKNSMNDKIEAFKTPIKAKPYKYKENILNTFLQDNSNQNKSKKNPIIPHNKNNSKIMKNSKQDNNNYYNQFIERKGKYDMSSVVTYLMLSNFSLEAYTTTESGQNLVRAK